MKKSLVVQLSEAASAMGKPEQIETIRSSRKVTYVRLTDVASILGLGRFPMIPFDLVPYVYTNNAGDYEIMIGNHSKKVQDGKCSYWGLRKAPLWESWSQVREAKLIWVRASWAVKVLKAATKSEVAERLAIITAMRLGYAVIPARFKEAVQEVREIFHFWPSNTKIVTVRGIEMVVMHKPWNFGEWQTRIHPTVQPLVSLQSDDSLLYCVFQRVVA